MLLLCLLCLLLLFTLPCVGAEAHGSGTIDGTVYDAVTRQPLLSVLVRLVETDHYRFASL